jgi:WhiB family transcriptional regulator, redox-sensing transcriptional regulator
MVSLIVTLVSFSPTLIGPGVSVQLATWDASSWREGAACIDANTDVFFPIGSTKDALAKTIKAKRYCAVCPVSSFCLEFALWTAQDYGVWGGLTEDERRRERRSRRAAARKLRAAQAVEEVAEFEGDDFVDELDDYEASA